MYLMVPLKVLCCKFCKNKNKKLEDKKVLSALGSTAKTLYGDSSGSAMVNKERITVENNTFQEEILQKVSFKRGKKGKVNHMISNM